MIVGPVSCGPKTLTTILNTDHIRKLDKANNESVFKQLKTREAK